MYSLRQKRASGTIMTMMTFRRLITWTSLGLLALQYYQVTANDRKRASYRLQQNKRIKERGAPRSLQTDPLVDDQDIEGWRYEFSHASSIKDIPKPCGKKGSSCAPTQFPSFSPSFLPTHSPAPSAPPTNLPSMPPTLSPTFRPSMGPTISSMPSTQPSSTPSHPPSRRPSQSPSQSPSWVPSNSPSASHAPTTPPTPSPLPYQVSTPGDNENVSSSCINQPPRGGGTIQDQDLVFQYNMYTTLEADFDQQVKNMETALHSSLSQQFLSCNYMANESFSFVSIDAAPMDTFNASHCESSNDPPPPNRSKCALVTSQLTMRAFFPQRRRLLLISNVTSSKVLEITGNYLESSMRNGVYETNTIVQVSFQGFLTGTGPTDGSTSAIRGNGNEENSSLSVTKSRLALGGAVVGLAALVVALALVVVNHHRERQQEAYLKHLEEEFRHGDDHENGLDDNDENDDDDDDDDGEHPGSLGDWRVRLVIDETDFNNVSGDTSTLSEVSRDSVAIQPIGRDFHRCNSATCPICQKRRIDPLFIQIQSMDRERLRAVASIRDSYRAPDTVDL